MQLYRDEATGAYHLVGLHRDADGQKAGSRTEGGAL
jgi:hypothetical protein